MKTKVKLGQPSWRMKSTHVEAYLTERGGHLGPVTFKLGRRKVKPFSVAPWVEEKVVRALPPILGVLRGDFFCMPFGGNAQAYRGEQHPIHGETANRRWKLHSLKRKPSLTQLHARLKTRIRAGQVDKWIRLVDQETTVYQQHVISAMSGPMNFGHHAMLKFPDEPGSGCVSTSAFVHGQVFPDQFEKAAEGGYQSLKPGATFTSLESVPLISGDRADLTRYPARLGFEDLVTIVSDDRLPFAWTAVTFPSQGYVWLALKDPRVLRQTVFWLSNRGRHYAPWSSRHVGVMGVEDVTSCFHYGLAESASQSNPLAKRGYQTCEQFNPGQRFAVNYIIAVAAIPAGFDRVSSITAAKSGVELTALNGKKTRLKLDLGFLAAGPLSAAAAGS